MDDVEESLSRRPSWDQHFDSSTPATPLAGQSGPCTAPVPLGLFPAMRLYLAPWAVCGQLVVAVHTLAETLGAPARHVGHSPSVFAAYANPSQVFLHSGLVCLLWLTARPGLGGCPQRHLGASVPHLLTRRRVPAPGRRSGQRCGGIRRRGGPGVRARGRARAGRVHGTRAGPQRRRCQRPRR